MKTMKHLVTNLYTSKHHEYSSTLVNAMLLFPTNKKENYNVFGTFSLLTHVCKISLALQDWIH
jgi:hypothetical protein